MASLVETTELPAVKEPPAVAEQPIPTVVSAAWELELVIAGGVTFALFQLPGSLDAFRLWAEPRATQGAMFAVFLAYVYAKIMVYVLIAAFVTNLAARAYWVGLVGLHSVFPRGVVWEKIPMGPAMSESYRARMASLPKLIARIDNFASVVFSFGFLVVAVCIFSLAASTVIGTVSWGISTLVFRGRYGLIVFETLMLFLALPLAAIALVDKRYGPRWAPDSTAGRRLRRLVRATTRINGAALFGPIYYTLATNLKRGVMRALFYVAFFSALCIALGEFLVRLGAVAGGSPRYMPDDEAIRTVRADYYESLRTAESSTRVPTIQSDVIDGPYVRLFIPYIAERHDPALARCKGASPARVGYVHLAVGVPNDARDSVETSADSTLACLKRMHVITIDGVLQRDAVLRFYTHPITGRPGMITYLATAPLAPGMHALHVMPPPRAPGSAKTGPMITNEIVFYK